MHSVPRVYPCRATAFSGSSAHTVDERMGAHSLSRGKLDERQPDPRQLADHQRERGREALGGPARHHYGHRQGRYPATLAVTISTFSCDTVYSSSPTALRASSSRVRCATRRSSRRGRRTRRRMASRPRRRCPCLARAGLSSRALDRPVNDAEDIEMKLVPLLRPDAESSRPPCGRTDVGPLLAARRAG